MKKKLSIIIPALIVLLIGAFVFPYIPAATKNYREEFDGNTDRSVLIDEYGFYNGNKQKYNELSEKIVSTAKKTKMNVIIYLSGKKDIGKSEGAIDKFTDLDYAARCPKEMDGVYLYLDICGQSPAHDTFACRGKAGAIFTEKERNAVLYAACSNLPASGSTISEDALNKTIEVFIDKLITYTKDYKSTSSSYSFDKVTKKYAYSIGGEFLITKTPPPHQRGIVFVISCVIGLIIGLITYSSISVKYKFKSSANPSVYVSREESDLTVKSDDFIRTYTTKHKIKSSSSGGGGGGGRTSGGSSGGGHFSSSRSR